MTSEFEKLRRSLLKSGDLFEDPDFPCINSSVFYNESPPFNLTWKRPHEICSDPKFLGIPISPDSGQVIASPISNHPNFESILGKCGDCWFVSSISSIYQTKGLFYRVVPADQSFEVQEYVGMFRFRIWWFGQWQEVIVDDRLPIACHAKLAFVQPLNGNIFWPVLLEKAFAKLHGSYEALKYGSSAECLSDLTGGVTEVIDLKCPETSHHVNYKSHMLDMRILMQRLLSMTCIVTAVISVDDCGLPQPQQQSSFVFGEEAVNVSRHKKMYEAYPQKSPSSLSISSSSSDQSPLQSLLNYTNTAQHQSQYNHQQHASHPTGSSRSHTRDPFPRLSCGIIANANYRVTAIERVETTVGENREQIFLLRLVNCLGSRVTYTGPFGDKRDLSWSKISESDRLRINSMDREEEEEEESHVLITSYYKKSGKHSFWIEFSDFIRIFTHLEVVYLDSETSRDEPSLRSGGRFPLLMKLYRGVWRRGVTAGGCRNNTESFHQNVQLELTLPLESDDMLIICLNQHSVLDPQVVGFSIYNSPSGGNCYTPSLSSGSSNGSSVSPQLLSRSVDQRLGRLDRSFFRKNKSLVNSSYSNCRQVLLRCSLERGSFVLMPTSFESGHESAFTVRVYSLKGIKLRLLDNENSMTKSAILKSPASFDQKFSEYEVMFMQIADEHKNISSHDLQELLESTLPNDYVKSCATTDVCRLIVSALDSGSSTGRLNFKDYKNFMCSLRFWQNTFKNHTKGTTGILRVERLEEALLELGFRLSTDVMSALILKFVRKDSTLRFGDFVAVILHLTISFNTFLKHQHRQETQRRQQMKQQQQQSNYPLAAVKHPHPLHNQMMSPEHHTSLNAGISSHNSADVSLSLSDWLKVSLLT